MKIRAYLKPHCRWSSSVRGVLRSHGLDFEEIDIDRAAVHYEEMVRLSGQTHWPCVEVDGVMLADVSGEELEDYLLSHPPVPPAGDAPAATNQPGDAPPAPAPQGAQITRFF